MRRGRCTGEDLGNGPIAEGKPLQQGFTLVEVLIAMAIVTLGGGDITRYHKIVS